MTTLTTTVCWNPFILNGRQVTNIIFYNDEGIMFETHRGWFGNGNNVFRTLNVGDVKTRRVTALEKMDKKENFCVTTKIPYSNDKGYVLYLYVDGEDIQLIKEEKIWNPTFMELASYFRLLEQLVFDLDTDGTVISNNNPDIHFRYAD